MRLNHIPHCTKTLFFAAFCLSISCLTACTSAKDDRRSPADVPHTHPAMQHDRDAVVQELSDDAARAQEQAEDLIDE